MTDFTLTPAPRSLRIGDADRDRTMSLLSEHYAAGRLTLDELTTRTDAAARAQSEFELRGLLHDLPPAGPAGASAAPVPFLAGRILGVLGEVGLGVLGLMAAFCLLMTLAVTWHSSNGFFVFIGALGGGTAAAAGVHYAHRLASSHRSGRALPAARDWGERRR